MQKRLIIFFVTLLILCISVDSAQIKIASVMIVKHPDLENAFQGFKDALAQEGLSEGDSVVYDTYCADGDKKKLSEIMDKFSSSEDQYNLFLAITAPCAIACMKTIKNKPVIYTVVKPSPVELGIAKSIDSSENNGTGQFMFQPIMQLFWLINNSMPITKSVAFIFDKNTNLSTSNKEAMLDNAKKYNINLKIFSIENAEEASEVIKYLPDDIEAIIIDNDMEVLKARQTIVNDAKLRKIPVFSTNETAVENGAVATMTPDYFEDGKIAGRAAFKVLSGKKPADIPIEKTNKFRLIVNSKTIEELNLKFAPNFIKKANRLIK